MQPFLENAGQAASSHAEDDPVVMAAKVEKTFSIFREPHSWQA